VPDPTSFPVLRLIDANANRAREGLRVLEDYARFVVDDRPISAALKAIRHELATALRPTLSEAIQHRNTAGDVGTASKTPTELQREGLPDVVIAACKRLGESLRALEEYLKTIDPRQAATVERLRYTFYDIETQIVRSLHPAKRFAQVRLYVLITEQFCHRPWLETAELALQGGADCLQLREKEMDARELLHRAKQLVELCRANNALCIINDRVDVALLSNADGVHVGQSDIPATEARKIVGRDKIVGVSTHCIEDARHARLDGADYIGVGPVFPSSTKPREILPGLAFAKEAVEQIPIPVVAIAGITLKNVHAVRATGVNAIAVTSAVTAAPDPEAAARELKSQMEAAAGDEIH
jgi:thiamine-phosphate pyrophosphorylase